MAGDWLKVEKETPHKPEILEMATKLGLDPDEVFGKCFRFWVWADSHTVDGHAKGVTPASLDRTLSSAGFAQALADVGWLQIRADGIQFPNFDRHMGESAKKRAMGLARQRRRRAQEGEIEGVGDDPVTQMSRCERYKNAPPLLFSKSEEVSSGVGGSGGKGGERLGPEDDQSWAAFLAVEWAFYFRGVSPSQRDTYQLDRFFESMMARGIAPQEILAKIRERSVGDRTEPTWEFEKRWPKENKGRQAKNEPSKRFRGK